jgi:hypothetical protein
MHEILIVCDVIRAMDPRGVVVELSGIGLLGPLERVQSDQWVLVGRQSSSSTHLHMVLTQESLAIHNALNVGRMSVKQKIEVEEVQAGNWQKTMTSALCHVLDSNE